MNKKLVDDLRGVFEDNVSAYWVPWRTAFYNFQDYIDELSKDKKISDRELMVEINRCSNLLLKKKIDPKGISTSFCNWKNEYS
jgi:translation initiation factor 2 beta subunit (eIF-2beta)/eIF-5